MSDILKPRIRIIVEEWAGGLCQWWQEDERLSVTLETQPNDLEQAKKIVDRLHYFAEERVPR